VRGSIRVRLRFFRVMGVVVALLGAACSDSGPEESHESASTSEVPNTISDSGSATCHSPATGCPCAPEGATMPCKTPPIRVGDYTSCEPGVRRCLSGMWGQCVGKNIGSK
jgi:hypothetical protein